VPLASALAEFQARAVQCDSLIGNAHRVDATGALLFPAADREQITVAAFLNLFIAWEGFIEDSMTKLMAGSPTISGNLPMRYVTPPTQAAAKAMVIGINRYFDYANHDNVRRVVAMYFDQGYPFEPHISGITSTLADLRTMRNASAHITSTTQLALEALAQRVFATPRPGIALYTLLVSVDPRSATGGTVFTESRDSLLTVAGLIASG
jgi:hypothetical protein